MDDFERINTPRVEKLIKMVDTIQRSARSNRVPDETLSAMLRPLLLKAGLKPVRIAPMADAEADLAPVATHNTQQASTTPPGSVSARLEGLSVRELGTLVELASFKIAEVADAA